MGRGKYNKNEEYDKELEEDGKHHKKKLEKQERTGRKYDEEREESVIRKWEM